MEALRRSPHASRRGPSLALLLPSLLVAGCGGLHLEDDAAERPLFDPMQWFPGETRAWGMVQDWRGRVSRRFDVDIEGRIEGDALVLDEHFRFADGERSSRVWTLTRTPDGRITGTAPDVVGTAAGATRGNAMRWQYTMDLTVDDSQYRVRFDDWLWLVTEDVLVNRAAIRKFGLRVGEVTLFMQKQTPGDKAAAEPRAASPAGHAEHGGQDVDQDGGQEPG